jgi:hypothetical protein
MSERKLLVEQDSSTFEKAFGKAARLPTPEDKKVAMEQSFAEMRKELHRPEYQPGSERDTRRPAGTNGWLSEQPLVNADTDRANELIEGFCNAQLPQPKPRVNIQSLAGIDEDVVRAKLEDACAKGSITRAQLEEALRALGGLREEGKEEDDAA